MSKIEFPRIGPPSNEGMRTAYRHDLSAELAAGGIDEWLDRLAVEFAAAPTVATDNGATIALDATDVDNKRSWHIRGLPKGIALDRGGTEQPAHVRLTGPATDLFVALVRRHSVNEAGIRLEGDAYMWQACLEGTPL